MAYQDLRAFMERLSQEGELHTINAEVDRDLEIGAISRKSFDLEGPALLFPRIKGYPQGHRILANIVGPAKGNKYGRLALALGYPKNSGPLEIIDRLVSKLRESVKPVLVSTGPCKENVYRGDEVDLLKFPAPLIHGGDGGHYLATWNLTISKDPDTGWVNWGMYRHMVHDRKSLAWHAAPFGHGGSMYRKYEQRGQPMPAAIAIGTEPVSSILAASPLPYGVDEADVVGALRGQPMELVKCETVDLEVPAGSEIVIEGHVAPGERRIEGPFGEYGGYTTTGAQPLPVFYATCVTHRHEPILTMSNMGKPWHEQSVVLSVARSAVLALELRERDIPFKSVYVPPPTFAVVISIREQEAGLAHKLASAIWSSSATWHIPYIFIVDEDVDVTNPEDVFWCLTTRLHPSRGIHIHHRALASPAVPFLMPEEKATRLTSYAVFDATFPSEWSPEQRLPIMDFQHGWPPEIRNRVNARWTEYGFD